jgi:hypothetical protein
MRAVVHVGQGEVEVNFMYLPTFIGMNAVLKRDMEEALQKKLQGLPLDDKGLDRAHEIVVEYLLTKFPEVKGLDHYLDALKYVES